MPRQLCTPLGPGGLFSLCVHINPTALSHLPFLQPQPTPSKPLSCSLSMRARLRPPRTSLCTHLCSLIWEAASPGASLDIYLWLSFPRRPFLSVLWRETLPCFRLLTTFLPEIKTILSVRKLACRPPPSVSFQVPGTQ